MWNLNICVPTEGVYGWLSSIIPSKSSMSGISLNLNDTGVSASACSKLPNAMPKNTHSSVFVQKVCAVLTLPTTSVSFAMFHFSLVIGALMFLGT